MGASSRAVPCPLESPSFPLFSSCDACSSIRFGCRFSFVLAVDLLPLIFISFTCFISACWYVQLVPVRVVVLLRLISACFVCCLRASGLWALAVAIHFNLAVETRRQSIRSVLGRASRSLVCLCVALGLLIWKTWCSQGGVPWWCETTAASKSVTWRLLVQNFLN